MKVKLNFMLVYLLISALFFSGCTSLIYRSESYPNKNEAYELSPGVYPGVRINANSMKQIVKGEADPLISGAEGFVFALSFIDIPLSFVIDTICLPYDITQIGGNAKDKDIESDASIESNLN